jgi:uncharacterized protein YyaL (SSP411 family)
VRPRRDDKILTDWNGLMIAALARASAALGEPEYASAASEAADFLLSEMRDHRGRLLHRYRDGEAAIPGMADDYAFLVWGLLELYGATFDPEWLSHALRLTEELVKDFFDAKRGGFFRTADDAERLIVRSKESYDGAVPAANSVAVSNLLRLSRLTGDLSLEELAAATIRGLSARVAAAPSGHTHLLSAVELALAPSREVVVVGGLQEEATASLLRPLQRRFLPRTVVLLKQEPPVDGPVPLETLAPFTRPLRRVAGRPAAYVCRDFTCHRPTTDAGELERLLK